MSDKLNKLFRSLPKIYQPENNTVINAILEAIAVSDVEILDQLDNVKAQLFVKTASGEGLIRLASSLGVAKPLAVGLTDEKFRTLIPNLSLKAKQISSIFYDTMDVFWGALYSRANITTLNVEPFNIQIGDKLEFQIDSAETQTLKIMATDDITIGATTASELVALINSKYTNITAEAIEDINTGSSYLSLRTNTTGLRGSIQILNTSSILGVAKLDLPTAKMEIWQQDQRTVLYQIDPNELVIEIPAIVPALRRTLKGSHHLHDDFTIELPVAPDNGIWAGSFIYDADGSDSSYTFTSQNCQSQEILTAGNVYTDVVVDNNSLFESEEGYLIFGLGSNHQEGPIRYRGIPNTATILLDPSYVFLYDQPINTYINVISENKPFVPAKTGEDLAIYLTSPSDARLIVQALLEALVTAGVIINFVILLPDFRYLIDNPYTDLDDAPQT